MKIAAVMSVVVSSQREGSRSHLLCCTPRADRGESWGRVARALQEGITSSSLQQHSTRKESSRGTMNQRAQRMFDALQQQQGQEDAGRQVSSFRYLCA